VHHALDAADALELSVTTVEIRTRTSAGKRPDPAPVARAHARGRNRRPRKSFGDHLLLHGSDLNIAERTPGAQSRCLARR
jgi:hypothetical protein